MRNDHVEHGHDRRQMKPDTNASYTYDKNGNTLTRVDSTGTTNYTWDYQNHLTKVTLPGTGGSTTYKYDPWGRRVQKAVTANSVTTTTNYIYDGSNILEELDTSGHVLARYSQDLGIDKPLAELRSATTSFYEGDGLGSITSLSSSAAALANTYTYKSFGKLSASTGTITNPFQYTARDFDGESGLNYYRARYYDPAIGRFISGDPIRFGGGVNFYDYVLNNPVTLNDPFGLETQWCSRNLKNVPGSSHFPPHSFLASTQAQKGASLGPKNGTGIYFEVPGQIEWEDPYDNSGKTKPGYSCSTISKSPCVETCVVKRLKEDTGAPPNYKVGKYQCDNYSSDVFLYCQKQCGGKQ
jgi:RHS repeat-associated protein